MRKLKKEIWPYQTILDNKEWGPNYTPEKWCRDNIGHRFKEWYSYRDNERSKLCFGFKDEATLLVFLIKWRW